MKPFIAALFAPLLLVGASAAQADVKRGVDAWNQGDYVAAVNEWRPLAIGGSPDAQFNLGQAYKLGRGVPVDLPVALEWFRKAAEQGHEKAADNYGLLLFQQGRREDSMPYIKASSERGEARAQYVYATALFNGDLAERDWVRAYALMTRASQSGVSQASASLAQMDRYIPEPQRSEGMALASTMARSASPIAPPAPALADTGPATPPPAVMARPAPQPKPQSTTKPAPTLASAPPVSPREGPAVRPPIRKSEPRATPTQQPAAVAALPSPAGTGRWRVQLGAFREHARAQALWKTLTGKVRGLSAFKPDYVTTNGLMRLMAGPLGSSADAQRLCAGIKPTGTPCVPMSL